MSKEILEDIIQNFEPKKFARFFRQKNSRFRPHQQELEQYSDENFQHGLQIGEIEFDKAEKLIICIFEVKHPLSERSGKKAQYELGRRILKTENINSGIFIFYDSAGNFRFSLIYDIPLGPRRKWSNFRRFTYFVSPDQTNKTFLKQIGEGDFSSLENIKEAFSVEKVTKEFFEEYVILFNNLKKYFQQQKVASLQQCHNYTQQLLNRIMFLYFVQKKKWLGDNKDFLNYFWEEYKKTGGENEFFDKWIKVMFFEAFNNRFAPRNYFPREINSALSLAPYLNGGLFAGNDLDDLSFSIEDEVFEQIFNFFNQYNFTIQESSELDIDLEVDPKLIGDVYESLVNVSDEDNERQEKGIFYTDRTEIRFMSGLALSEYFSRYLKNKKFWLEYFFGNNKEEFTNEFTSKDWKIVKRAVEELSVLDPACGSGSFLVMLLEIISEIYQLALEKLKIDKTVYEIKKFIVANCLYGVDVKGWAVHIAELRLWLQLVVYADLDLGERRMQALLPNLTFKIRQGDSLVQELAGVNLASRGRTNVELDKNIKRRITELKKEKIKFTNNEEPRKFSSAWMIENEEKSIYQMILDSRIKKLREEIKLLKKEKYNQQISLPGFKNREAEQKELFEKQKQENILKIEQEIEKIKEVKNIIQKKKPFVWDIDFVEIFSNENEGGFDIVIGNPPYVRREKIADPFLSKDEISNKNKQEYKEKLLRAVQNKFPFIKKLDKKSDLYIYFYFLGLSLLNPQGVLCFITSNSWLDVGYGKDLQKFLLENVKIKAIYDNSAKRSFATADVNTIIALFSAPDIKNKKDNLENLAKFIVFKKPFEEVVRPDILIKIKETKQKISNNDFRVFPKKQKDLLEEGTEYETKEQKKMGVGEYVGDKWGGKYLRAPDIFFTILEKGKHQFVRLKNVAEVGGYIHGNNIGDNYEKVYFVGSIQNLKNIILTENSDGVIIFGVKKTGNSRKIADILFPRMIGSRFFAPIVKGKVYAQKFYKINLLNTSRINSVSLFLNSSLQMLMNEIIMLSPWGLGALSVNSSDIKKLLVLQDIKIDMKKIKIFNRPIKSIFEECGINPKSDIPIEKQEPKPLSDRAELDKIVFDTLGLTKDERKEVYRAVCRLVWNRISKAKSV